MKKYGLPVEKPRTLVSVLETVNQLGYDPRRIVLGLACLKSLRQTERRLKNDCKVLELRAARYRQVLPSCEETVRLGIGIEELIAFHAAVTKRAAVEGLPMSTSAYRVLVDIEKYNELGGLQKQLNETMNMQMVNHMSARQKHAVNSFIKLQLYGWTEDQILKACRLTELNGHNWNPQYAKSINPQ